MITAGGFDSFCFFDNFCSFQSVVAVVGCSTAATVVGQNYKLEFVMKSAGTVDAAGRGSVSVVDFAGTTAAAMPYLYSQPVVVFVDDDVVVDVGIVVADDIVAAAGETLFYPMA